MKSRLCVLILLLCLLFPLSTLQAQGDTIVPIAYGQTAQGQIKTAKSLAVFAFAGQKGDQVTITVKSLSSDFQPGVILTDKNAKTLANGIKEPIDGFELPVTAAYMIVVSSVRGTGQFSLSLENGGASVENTPESGGISGTGQSQEIPILFSSNFAGNWDIYSINPDGSNPQRLTTGEGNKHMPFWSPYGTQIAYRVDANALYVMNADGSNAHQVTRGTYYDYYAIWSPDGKRFAVASGTAWDQNDIYITNVDGSMRKLIADTNKTARYPAWSPDGKQIIFTKNDGNTTNTYTVGANGGSITLLAKGLWDARWSPDGKTLALANGDLWLMKNGEFMQVARTPNDSEWHPSWSPDGQQIAFLHSSDNDATHQIFVMSADGSGEVKISPAGWDCLDVSWSSK